MSTVKLALIGAGNRGGGIFGQYGLDMPHRCRFTAVVEPDPSKRKHFAAQHTIPPERCFENGPSFFAADLRDIDAVVIATREDQRLDPVVASMQQGYHILVEKPLCTNVEELLRLYDSCYDYEGIVIVCHQMRLSPGPRTVKELIDSGRYGDVICLQHSENLSYSHMAHSFVRGFFNHSSLTPMLLAKSCHDMDIMTHWIGGKACRVSSFGSLTHFTKANCPEGAPAFCLEGCPASKECPYDVLKLYFNDDTDPAYLRQMGVVTSKDQLRELLQTNRFGRCVFQTDNDAVDHQTVQIEYEDGVLASFTMCGHNGVERRISKFSMTNGEIEYDASQGTITAHSFEPLRVETFRPEASGTHNGGDRAIMDNFMDAIVSGDRSGLLTPIRDSLEGHLLVFAAEEARATGSVVQVREFEARARSGLSGTS
ncbi:MAG: Gfo/Idh/MocA family oxidoreductase [Lentisphaerae bacterium]|nr:Gfo/Idh/MocA family oxidoreductase [Lentisphaerota bacterium]